MLQWPALRKDWEQEFQDKYTIIYCLLYLYLTIKNSNICRVAECCRAHITAAKQTTLLLGHTAQSWKQPPFSKLLQFSVVAWKMVATSGITPCGPAMVQPVLLLQPKLWRSSKDEKEGMGPSRMAVGPRPVDNQGKMEDRWGALQHP